MPSSPDIRAVTLVVTAGCNLRCRYCYQDRKHEQVMPWPVLKAALDMAARSRERRVSVAFLGGEPLLEARLIRRAIRYACGRRAAARWQFALTTNGLLLTPRLAAFLATHKVRLQLSFDGVAAAQDLRARGSFATLDRLLGHLARAHPSYFRRDVSVAVTVAPQAIPHLAASVRYLLAKDVRRIVIAPAVGRPGWRAGRFGELERQLREVAAAVRQDFARSGRIPIALMRRSPDWKPAPPLPRELCCGVANGTSVVVDVDGRLYPCVTLAQSYQDLGRLALGARMKTLQVGHILDDPLQDRRPALRERARGAGLFCRQGLKRSSHGPCASCDLLGACAICPVVSAHDSGVADPRRVSDYLCAFTRAALTHLVR